LYRVWSQNLIHLCVTGLFPGWGLPESRAGDRYLCVFLPSFVVRLASAASLCAQLQGAHVHGHGHVVPRARRAEWKRSGTDRAGWQRAVGPVLRTATLAAAARFHHRRGRDELTLVTDERRRTNGRNGTRTSGQEGGERVDWSARSKAAHSVMPCLSAKSKGVCPSQLLL
jgi:hypothetical protein